MEAGKEGAMRWKMLGKSIRAVMLAASAMLILARAAGQTETQSSPVGGAVICRVLEAKTVERMNVAVVLFHQAHESDSERLGQLLRQHDGAAVEFETGDARPHAATVLRLGACFGRGLLVFPATEARLAKKDQFWLRFPQ
jgi:hypothetical protein